ncbi:MAG: TrmH family RNA methyltransferase, partial [Erysipelotrichia bacterium]|nr:TrmH family RNA methyltransferase [Erysipelotrichia bacterium]
FGNEATGLPSNYQNYGQSVLIKHLNTIDSLNLCNAVSIALYQFTKGRL